MWFSNPYLQNVLFHYPQKVQQHVHDADGNLTHDQYLHYVYDAENRLTKVFGFGFQMEMKYDSTDNHHSCEDDGAGAAKHANGSGDGNGKSCKRWWRCVV